MNSSNENRLYILIDDDLTHNEISRLMISNTISGAEILEFPEPERGLYFLTDEFDLYNKKESIIVLLNLNMPAMSGWEFLDRFAALEKRIRDRVTIHILTSSIHSVDRLRSERIAAVKSFLTKPLSSATILGL
jgi:CheY-like chemotaxis protein